jgi:hypothetical protein
MYAITGVTGKVGLSRASERALVCLEQTIF